MDKEQLIELTYSSQMHDYYHSLCHLPGFVLLESGDKARGRYDIVSACPYESISIPADASNIDAYLEELKIKIPLRAAVNDLPFQGGAIGYISYDLGARLLDIHARPQPGLHSMPLLHLGLYDWAIITDHQQQKVYLFAAHQHHSTVQNVAEVLTLWRQSLDPVRCQTSSAPHSLMSRPQYSKAFLAIKKALKIGRSYQVNLTQPFLVEYTGDPWAAYKKISAINPVPFAAFLRMAGADILSFSPERFLLYEQGVIRTSPIKGTIRRSADPLEDEALKQELRSSAKNRAENVMIVDLLRNDLGKIAQTGSVLVSKLCEVQSYNAVHHLVSDITAHAKAPMHPLDVFFSCFPGGSITGAPKLEAMRIINELELFGRGIYCGAIAYFSHHGVFDSNIAIRTITATNNTFHFSAGGGIVMDSEEGDEYRECFIKIKAIMDGLDAL